MLTAILKTEKTLDILLIMRKSTTAHVKCGISPSLSNVTSKILHSRTYVTDQLLSPWIFHWGSCGGLVSEREIPQPFLIVTPPPPKKSKTCHKIMQSVTSFLFSTDFHHIEYKYFVHMPEICNDLSWIHNHRYDYMIKIHHITTQYFLGHIVWDSGNFFTHFCTT
jgi:hypothetical protein